jgi:hypothetical protein
MPLQRIGNESVPGCWVGLSHDYDAPLIEVLSLSDVSSQDPLAELPKNPTAPMQTPMINANMTAYSTAVGPLSSLKKRNSECIPQTPIYSPAGEAWKRRDTKQLQRDAAPASRIYAFAT